MKTFLDEKCVWCGGVVAVFAQAPVRPAANKKSEQAPSVSALDAGSRGFGQQSEFMDKWVRKWMG